MPSHLEMNRDCYIVGDSIISSMIDKMKLAQKDHSINSLDFSDINLRDNESDGFFTYLIMPTELQKTLKNSHVTSINCAGAKLGDVWRQIAKAIEDTLVISINSSNVHDYYFDECRIQIEDQTIKNKIQFTNLICKNFEKSIDLPFDLVSLICSYLECSDLTNLYSALQIDSSHEHEVHLSGE